MTTTEEQGEVCTKLKYKSREAARRANANARFRIRAYFHKPCRAWHVTNADKR